jgi:hypothetical protein
MGEFRKIALASTFSPRFLPLLAEAQRFANRFGGRFAVIHSGPREKKSEEVFAQAFADFAFDPPPEIIWVEEKNPHDAIARAIGEAGIDILILGALEKQTPGRFFLGNVARSLLKTAPSSLLFLPRPELGGAPIRTIVVAAGEGESALRSLYLGQQIAEQDHAARVCAISVVSVFAKAQAAHEGEPVPMKTAQSRLEELVKHLAPSSVPIDTRCIESTTGFAASEFVQTIGADLLVVGSTPAKLLPEGMDWLCETIPTNLLVVRKTTGSS